MVGVGRGAQVGVLIRNAEVLERIATGHRVELNGHVFHALCAVDELGVADMYSADRSSIVRRQRMARAAVWMLSAPSGARILGAKKLTGYPIRDELDEPARIAGRERARHVVEREH